MLSLKLTFIVICFGLNFVECFEKSRWKLKNVLNRYVNSGRNGGSERALNNERQLVDKDFPDVECTDDLISGTCSGDQDRYLGSIFEAYKFRLYQVENNFQKYKRISNYAKITRNKYSKGGDFTNTSLWLEAIVGGDVSNPVCNGNSGTTSGDAVVELYNNLIQCNQTITSSCVINEPTLKMDSAVFEQCNVNNEELKDKIDECRKYDQADEAEREPHCQCLDAAVAKIELFKSTKFPLTTDEGEVEENCIKLLSASSPLVVAQWKACTRAIIDCKQDQDAAIAIINTCHSDSSSSRLFFSYHEDYDEEMDEDDYDIDYDY